MSCSSSSLRSSRSAFLLAFVRGGCERQTRMLYGDLLALCPLAPGDVRAICLLCCLISGVRNHPSAFFLQRRSEGIESASECFFAAGACTL